jgi:hypothetical protein
MAVGLAVAVAPAQPAWACKCAQRTEPQLTQAADVVFMGRVRSVRQADPSSTVRAVLSVARVRKGDVPAQAVVTTSASSASCGVYFERGARYLVYAHRDGRRLTTNLCAGTSRVGESWEPCPLAEGEVRASGAAAALLGANADRSTAALVGAAVDPSGAVAAALVRAAVDPPAAAARRPADVRLEVEVRDTPDSAPRAATLICRGDEAEAGGFLAGDAEAACQAARRLGPWLAAPPEPSRACTYLYGGPQTARMTGAVGEDRVRRRFSRDNGCGVADWSRAALLLGGASRPEPAAVLVHYVRSGGIAGLEDHLSVTRRGVATVTRRGSPSRTVVVAPERRAALESALERANFPRLRPEYLPRHPIADAFSYAVTYEGKTVRATDTAVPRALEPVLEALDGIWASAW